MNLKWELIGNAPMVGQAKISQKKGHGGPLVVSSDDSAKDLGDDEDMSREMQK